MELIKKHGIARNLLDWSDEVVKESEGTDLLTKLRSFAEALVGFRG